MKIIYLITKSNWGGAQKYVYDLATGLERDKFEVKVVAGGRGVLIEELRKKGIETISLPPLQENTNFIKTVISLKNAAALLRLAKIFWKEKPQIVHLNSSKIAGLGAVAAWFVKTLRAQRMDIVMTVHGWPFLEDRPRWEQLIIKFLSKLTARFQNKIILINTLDLNIAESFLPQKKLNLIFNGNAPIDFLTRPAARAFLSSQIGSTDETGEIVDGDQIIGLCAIQMALEGSLQKNTVVTTPMSNMGLELTLREHGISMVRAQVGDRYVVETMRKNGYNLGGEQSGHVVFLDHATTGDGIVAALKVLEAMRRTGKPLSELRKAVRLLPQVREDVRVSKRAPIEDQPKIAKAIANAQEVLRDRGRVFIRFSGTEPLVRVMLEGEDLQQIQTLAKEIAAAVEKSLS